MSRRGGRDLLGTVPVPTLPVGACLVPRRNVVADTGNVLTFSGTITDAAFEAAVAAAPAGPLTVQPVPGQSSFTVSPGDIEWSRQDLTIKNAVLRDVGASDPNDGLRVSASGFTLQDCDIHCINVNGANDWTLLRVTGAFNAVSYNGNGGSILTYCQNWQILDSSFSGCYIAADPTNHSEAFNIRAAAQNGLFDGCSFDNNGSTAHLFFTWYDVFDTPSLWPANICVQNCDFTNSQNNFYHIQARPEYPNDLTYNIRLDTTTCTWDSSASQFSDHDAWEVPCS